MTTHSNIIKGRCHCGNIHLELHTNRAHGDFTPRSCQCTLCQKHGARWISDPEGVAHVRLTDSKRASFYRFGHGTSDFILCSTCGVLMIAVCNIDGIDRAVLNTTSMTNEQFPTPAVATNFDDEDVEARLLRRAQNWTGKVIFG